MSHRPVHSVFSTFLYVFSAHSWSGDRQWSLPIICMLNFDSETLCSTLTELYKNYYNITSLLFTLKGPKGPPLGHFQSQGGAPCPSPKSATGLGLELWRSWSPSRLGLNCQRLGLGLGPGFKVSVWPRSRLKRPRRAHPCKLDRLPTFTSSIFYSPGIIFTKINIIITRKPCSRKETARCRSGSFRFKVRPQHSLQV